MTRLQQRHCETDAPSALVNLPPILQRVYQTRGITHEHQLNRSLSQLIPPDQLGGLDAAVRTIARAIIEQRHITVAGDYDCDGATGTAVAYRGLKLLGAENVGNIVPDRAIHGYGLSTGLVDSMDPKTQLIVTVDSGTSSLEGINHARAKGMQVVVTDHHLPGDELPVTEALVNPNLKDDPFPSKMLAGVGVVFYVLLAVRKHLRQIGYFGNQLPNLASLLPLVAVGTVADLVPLDQNNRILVHNGLRQIRQGNMPIGLATIIELSGRNYKTLVASDIAFTVAPVLNAAGRIETMGIGVEALITDSRHRAKQIVENLLGINATRKQMQAEMVSEAEELTKNLTSDNANGVTVFSPTWHAGIVGLVASKLKETLHRPVFALAPSEEGSSELRGSGRSIPGIHLRDALALMDARNPGLLPKFGGHAMAAGLSLHIDNVQRFSDAFEAVISEMMTDEMRDKVIHTDGMLQAGELSLDTAWAIRNETWGQAFPEPVFEGTFHVLGYKVLKEQHLRLDLAYEVDGTEVCGIHFFGYTGEPVPERVRIAFEMSINEFRERFTLQLLIRHLEPAIAI